MSRILAVTGTDTGIGKTWVSCGLLRRFRADGLRVAARKPVETGCEESGGRLHAADAAALAEAAGGEEPADRVCRVRFAEPLAPAIAAERAGRTIDPTAIVDECRARAREVDLLLVEGAGGLLVPFAGRETFADLAVALGARLVVVVGARLGAINHAMLTVEAARSRGLEVAAVVVNRVFPVRDLAIDTLAATLASAGACERMAEAPHGEAPDAALATVAREIAATRS
ncbi:MAG: dethiobiotin synthase [Alphaproteobacteria bacterium]